MDLSKPYVVRLQGYDYRKFRDSFHKPYDPTFQWAMILTMNDLLLSFKAKTAHTHTFQILLFFDGSEPKMTLTPNKLLTMYTSFATVRFNEHIVNEMNSPNYISSYLPSQVAKIATKQAMFYGDYLDMKQMENECVHKPLGLAIKIWAHDMLDAKECEGKKPEELVKMLPVRWQLDVPRFISYGVFGKIKMKGSDSVDLRAYYLWNEDLISQLFEYEFAFDMPPYSGGGDRIDKEIIYNVQKRDRLLLPQHDEYTLKCISHLQPQIK